MTKKKADITFEAAFERLAKIIDALESDSTSLDESLALYEEGVTVSEFCATKLAQTQQRLKELKERADGIFEVRDSDEL